MQWDAEEVEDVASVLKAVGNPTRLAVVLELRAGNELDTVVDTFEITRSGLQNHIEYLIDAGLVYRPRSGEQTYDLTPLGEEVADWTAPEFNTIAEMRTVLAERQRQAENEFVDVPLDGRDLDKAVQNRLWELAWDDLDELRDTSERSEE